MITLHFSECCEIPAFPIKIEIAQQRFARQRGDYYEKILVLANGSSMDFVTYDELCVIVAQFLKRTQGVDIGLVSWCACRAAHNFGPDPRVIRLDEGGDMVDDPHHNYFNQRMKYLR